MLWEESENKYFNFSGFRKLESDRPFPHFFQLSSQKSSILNLILEGIAVAD